MERKRLVLVVVFGLAVCGSGVFHSTKARDDNPGASQRWEYKFVPAVEIWEQAGEIPLNHDFKRDVWERIFNEKYGAAGRELVCVHRAMWVFKRAVVK